MNALIDMLRQLLLNYADQSFWSALVTTLLAYMVAFAAARGLYRLLQELSKRLAGGPVFLLASLVVGLVYLGLLIFFTLTGRSFERGVLEVVSGITLQPIDGLGGYEQPFLITLLYPVFHLVYLLLVLALAWALGLFSAERRGEGSVAQAVEEELGTSYAMQLYKLFGYHRPDVPEKRLSSYVLPLVKALRWCKWLTLPLVMTGGVPAGLWVASAVVLDGLVRNLTPPASAPEEEERKEEAEVLAPLAVRDPAQLLQALQHDPRGPQLVMHSGGEVQGRPEHLTERTRVADESRIMADVLKALSIDGFYVHQEAAAEAIMRGDDVLMETPPSSGRRTLCDILALRAVLLQGGTVVYVSPNEAESARRAEAFRRVAQQSNWRWAIHHRDLAHQGREGLDLKLRQPSILFTTPAELASELCRLHGDWDHFMQSLAMIVAIDLDRYIGASGANFMGVMRRLMRLAERAGARPAVLATVAPFGSDVQSFAERIIGRPLYVVGPESDSRGAPGQFVVVSNTAPALALHPAVAARGVGLACGYQTEIWDHDKVLTHAEGQQQVNKVLLEFGKAVVGAGDPTHLRFDQAHALVVRLSAEKAAMIPYFTRHAGRDVLGVATFAAQEVGATRRAEAAKDAPALPFSGFARPIDDDAEPVEDEVELALDVEQTAAAAAEGEPAADAAEGDVADAAAAQVAAALQAQPELAVSLWLADDDAFSLLLSRHPNWLHPLQLHSMLSLGARLVASASDALLARHLLAAAAEAPISRQEAAQRFSTRALAYVVEQLDDSRRLVTRSRQSLDEEGRICEREELLLEGDPPRGGSTLIATERSARLINRAGGETVLQTDGVRALAVAYPGRVLLSRGRRYRVLLPGEQNRLDEDVLWAEPERRRIATARVRRCELEHDIHGHNLALGGKVSARLGYGDVKLTETVLGLRLSQPARGYVDTLSYDEPLICSYRAQAAVVRLGEASEAALEALELLLRVTLPAFVRHEEDDLDVVRLADGIAFIDRHPGGAGFARAVDADVLRHALYWSRQILALCTGGSFCREQDGCRLCVWGGPRLSPDEAAQPSRRQLQDLLERLLGGGPSQS